MKLGQIAALAALGGGLVAFDYKDPPEGSLPFDPKSPVLYDVASPRDAFRQLQADPNLHFAYGEQVLRALEDTARPKNKVADPERLLFEKPFPRTSGEMAVSVTRNDTGQVIFGRTQMPEESPYVYADTITLSAPPCKGVGNTHLTLTYRMKGEEGVRQSIETTGRNIAETKSTVSLGAQETAITGAEHVERMEAYNQLVARVMCL